MESSVVDWFRRALGKTHTKARKGDRTTNDKEPAPAATLHKEQDAKNKQLQAEQREQAGSTDARERGASPPPPLNLTTHIPEDAEWGGSLVDPMLGSEVAEEVVRSFTQPAVTSQTAPPSSSALHASPKHFAALQALVHNQPPQHSYARSHTSGGAAQPYASTPLTNLNPNPPPPTNHTLCASSNAGPCAGDATYTSTAHTSAPQLRAVPLHADSQALLQHALSSSTAASPASGSTLTVNALSRGSTLRNSDCTNCSSTDSSHALPTPSSAHALAPASPLHLKACGPALSPCASPKLLTSTSVGALPPAARLAAGEEQPRGASPLGARARVQPSENSSGSPRACWVPAKSAALPPAPRAPHSGTAPPTSAPQLCFTPTAAHALAMPVAMPTRSVSGGTGSVAWPSTGSHGALGGAHGGGMSADAVFGSRAVSCSAGVTEQGAGERAVGPGLRAWLASRGRCGSDGRMAASSREAVHPRLTAWDKLASAATSPTGSSMHTPPSGTGRTSMDSSKLEGTSAGNKGTPPCPPTAHPAAPSGRASWERNPFGRASWDQKASCGYTRKGSRSLDLGPLCNSLALQQGGCALQQRMHKPRGGHGSTCRGGSGGGNGKGAGPQCRGSLDREPFSHAVAVIARCSMERHEQRMTQRRSLGDQHRHHSRKSLAHEPPKFTTIQSIDWDQQALLEQQQQ